MAYHKTNIKKGVYGEFSKIKEEYQEFKDAHEQGDKILQLCELSDLIGAIEGYVKKWNMSLQDVVDFSDKTQSAFKEGKRTSSQ
jgi:phosphoribosyl-ATP pyrophosphohydrolase